jgi:hypothetical protein
MDVKPEDSKIKYRGIDRDCLTPYKDSNRNFAEIRMEELFPDEEKSVDDFANEDFIPENYINEIYSWLGQDASKFETIFVKKTDIMCEIPEHYLSIGFEPSYFYADHFSASCDCMLFPRWHGTDKEGLLFLKYFEKFKSIWII